ncbi:MAG TPA: hypothetical protein VFV38_52335 [Ktedonobacteraceae bacterium]|nr:hypothetical protein [Ktedonobacteraceae bacterium]
MKRMKAKSTSAEKESRSQHSSNLSAGCGFLFQRNYREKTVVEFTDSFFIVSYDVSEEIHRRAFSWYHPKNLREKHHYDET